MVVMPLSITCSCGARLEIDDRFAGQVIPCPDCQAPLSLPAPAPTQHPRVSGLAVASLMVALVTGFTLVGGLAAILLGYVARRRIERQPGQYSGQGFARAGMVIGAVGTVLACAALMSPEVFHLDALLREFRWAKRLDYTHSVLNPPVLNKPSGENQISLTMPSRRWGELVHAGDSGDRVDHVILFDVWNDAQLACQSVFLDDVEDRKDWDAARRKGLERFLQSQLVSVLERRGATLPKELTPHDIKQLDENSQEMLVDLRLGVDRTFLVRMTKKGPRLFVLVGGARKHRGSRLHDEFRKAFDSFQVQ